jgi:hypothetical protein
MTDDPATRAQRRIDVTRLPEDVVALVDALGPGDELVITRDGAWIATVASAYSTFDDEHPQDEVTEEIPVAYDNVTVVATAMKLSKSARAALAAELGADYIVLDMLAAPTTADVLLVPPASPQLIGRLRSRFPDARVIVTEIEDAELGVSYHGPVRRMLDAGAETYLSSTTIPRLAAQLDHTITQHQQLTSETTAPLEIEAGPMATPAAPDRHPAG